MTFVQTSVKKNWRKSWMSNELEKEFKEIIQEDGLILVIFNMAQELVQIKEPETKEAQALNIITGSAFALLYAIKNYKEIKNGKSISNRSRITHSKDGSRPC